MQRQEGSQGEGPRDTGADPRGRRLPLRTTQRTSPTLFRCMCCGSEEGIATLVLCSFGEGCKVVGGR